MRLFGLGPFYMEMVRTDRDGFFLFTEVPPGDEFELEGVINLSDFPPGTAGTFEQIISVPADANLNIGEYKLIATDLILLSPVRDSTLSDAQPSLSWEPYPGASYYHLELKQAFGSYTDLELDTTEPQVDLELPLMACTYGWDVIAYNDAGTPLARSDFAYWDDPYIFSQQYDGIFTIENDSLPWCEIILISPAYREEINSGSNYALAWELHPLGVKYNLSIVKTHDANGKYIPGKRYVFSESFVVQEEGSGPVLPYLARGKYEWRICAYMEDGGFISESRKQYFYIR